MRHMRSSNRGIVTNQDGMAAIVITTVLMIVISLIVISFTQSIRNEQRQALDNQLSTQAFYAAESGINLAKAKLSTAITNSTDINKKKCGKSDATNDSKIGSETVIQSELDIDLAGTDSTVTCLLVSNEVPAVYFESVDTDAKITKLEAVNGQPITSVTFKWWANGTESGSPTCATSPSFGENWTCRAPLLRADIVPFNSASINRGTLQADQFTSFFYPHDAAAGTAFNLSDARGAQIGRVLNTKCVNNASTGKSECTATVNTSSNQLAVRVMGLYKQASIEISITTGAGVTSIKDAQYIIDSTARAVDVVRRVQARVSTRSISSENFALNIDAGNPSSLGVCKRYKIIANTVDDSECR